MLGCENERFAVDGDPEWMPGEPNERFAVDPVVIRGDPCRFKAAELNDRFENPLGKCSTAPVTRDVALKPPRLKPVVLGLTETIGADRLRFRA